MPLWKKIAPKRAFLEIIVLVVMKAQRGLGCERTTKETPYC